MQFFRECSNKFLSRKICEKGLCFTDSDIRYLVQT